MPISQLEETAPELFFTWCFFNIHFSFHLSSDLPPSWPLLHTPLCIRTILCNSLDLTMAFLCSFLTVILRDFTVPGEEPLDLLKSCVTVSLTCHNDLLFSLSHSVVHTLFCHNSVTGHNHTPGLDTASYLALLICSQLLSSLTSSSRHLRVSCSAVHRTLTFSHGHSLSAAFA